MNECNNCKQYKNEIQRLRGNLFALRSVIEDSFNKIDKAEEAHKKDILFIFKDPMFKQEIDG